MNTRFVLIGTILFFVMPVHLSHAGNTTVDCSKKSLTSEIDKLDRTASNIIEVTGNCTEDILISGHKDLTLIGVGGASITATIWNLADPFTSTTPLHIKESKVTVENLTFIHGLNGVFCDLRSQCVLRDVTIQAGWDGIYVQNQSTLDLIGSSTITGAQNNGIQVYGASSVNLRPTWASGFDPDEAGPVVSGSGFSGLLVSDGSFLRADNVTVSNGNFGVWAQRNSTLKFFSLAAGTGTINNFLDGITLWSTSTGQILGSVSGNGGSGVFVGPLSFMQDDGIDFSGNGADVTCAHATSVSSPDFLCTP